MLERELRALVFLLESSQAEWCKEDTQIDPRAAVRAKGTQCLGFAEHVSPALGVSEILWEGTKVPVILN